MGTKASSLLVADIGSTMTTVGLIDQVGGQRRFVARGEAISTHGSPWGDAVLGVQAAVYQIEALVGRVFLDGAGTLVRPPTANGDGVDQFVAVSSAAPPMRVLLVALTHDHSLSSLRHAVDGANVLTVDTLALDESPQRREPNAWQDTLSRAGPDVILIAGGTDGGATRPVLEMVQLVAQHNRLLAHLERPVVCYAGNAQLTEQVVHIFAGSGELRTTANVRPSLHVENIAPASRLVDALYRARRLDRLPGMARLSEWAGGPILTAARSFGHLVHYVGERYRLNTIGFDLGSGHTVLAHHAGQQTDDPVRDLGAGSSPLITRADLGVGKSISTALAHISLDRITRWLPFEMTEDDVREALLNKASHPESVPQTGTAMLLEHALARELIRETVSAQSAAAHGGEHGAMCRDGSDQRSGLQWMLWDLIIGAGRTLTRAPHPGHAVGMLLDALEPVGVSKLALDASGTAGLLGAVAASDPLAAVEVVEHDAFLTLGTIVAPGGRVAPGAPALQVSVRCQDGATIHAEREVRGGALCTLPLRSGQAATVELHPAPGLDLGVGRPGTSVKADVEGGVLGIVIDTRGRPLSLPEDANERRRAAREWLSALTGQRVGEPRR